MRRRMTFILAAALGAMALLAAACGDGERVRVFAASSLTDVLSVIATRYEQQHPDAEIELSFAGSQTLATQIEEGAPAELFISANPEQAQRLLDAGLVERSVVLAENRLIVAVRDDAPWQTVEEVAAAGVPVAVGAPRVPVGGLTRVVLDLLDPDVAERLRAQIVTEDPNVRVVLSRVELGEVDAAFVYHTDLAGARGLRAIELPPEAPRNEYVAVLVADRDRGGGAADFLEFLLGEEAQALLFEAGFLPAGSQAAP